VRQTLASRVARRFQNRLDFRTWLEIQRIRATPWLRNLLRMRSETVLDEAALRGTRRSDTAFLFGSGSSLNELTASDWEHVAAHDTIGFNYFSRQRFVRTDYHIVGEIATSGGYDRSLWMPGIDEYARLITENPFYANTIVGIQTGWTAYQSNRLMTNGRLGRGRRFFHYRRIARGVFRPPSRSLSEGLVHGAGSLVGCVNFAYVMGWRQIVIAGVDLYDSRYFWLPDDESRPDLTEHHGLDQTSPHPTGDTLVPYLGRWRELLEREGVRLSVYNPRSLLTRVLPVYAAPARGHE
jgi:hypothetical protein